MNLMQQPLLSVVITAALAVAFVVVKVIERVSSASTIKEIHEDGVLVRTEVVKTEGIDFGSLPFVLGFGAWICFIWMLQTLGVFS